MGIDRVQAGHYTHPGRRYGTLNQDSFLALKIHPEQEIWLLGAFDGHGLLGEAASSTAALAVKNALTDRKTSWVGSEDPHDAVAAFRAEPHANMQKLFDIAHEAILQLYSELPETYTYVNGKTYKLEFDRDIPVYRASKFEKRDLEFGTTATVVLYIDGFMVAGNSGDSRAFVMEEDLSGASDDGFKAIEFTELHTIANPVESLRLAGLGRTTFTAEEYIRPLDSRWIGHQVAFSRALGHKYLSEFGITHVPSVYVRNCTGKDFAIVLTTDGVTDLLTPEEVAERVATSSSAKDAAHVLVEDALQMCEMDDDADNATAVVLLLKPVYTGISSRAGLW